MDRGDHIGKGIVERVSDPYDWWKWADLIVYTDNLKWLHAVQTFRDRGWPVVSASLEAATWEVDRDAGQAIFKRHGIKTIPGKAFSDYDTAISHVKARMGRFVSKPSGAVSDKSMSYVSKGPADMVYMLERWKKSFGRMDFILQDFVPGIEMAVGGWVGPGGFAPGWCENWEEKKLMAGNLGINTGEQGTTMRHVSQSKLADIVLKPLEDALVRCGHVGYVDVNCMVDAAGTPLPLEFTMRFGWPCFDIQQALVKGDPAEWLFDLATGGKPDPWVRNDIAVGVVVSIPDYPYSRATRKDTLGIPVYGYADQADDLHPCDMMMGEAPCEKNGKIGKERMMVTAGDYVLIASGTAETVSGAAKKAYATIKALEIPNSPMWRIDISKRLAKQLPELQKHGFAKGMAY